MLETMLIAYIETALWSSVDDEGRPLDEAYSADYLAGQTLQRMRQDCEKFLNDNKDLLEGLDPGQIGYDFWLTRNGHGAGFWDRGLGEQGELLTEAAQKFPQQDLYAGDDGKLYLG